MRGTIAEQILGQHAGHTVTAGEIVIAPVDFVFSHDGNRPQPLQTFESMGDHGVFAPNRIAFFLDHAPNAHTAVIAGVHDQIRRFAAKHGTLLYDIGSGISHRVLPEKGHAVPGSLIVGSDSHTCTAGAFNLLATGMGSADIAVAMRLGKSWFRVPNSIRLVAEGRLSEGVHAKDLALYWLGQLGAEGGNYRALEFTGPAIGALTMDERMTITNSAVEMGAKFGLMEADETTRAYLADVSVTEYQETQTGDDDRYERILTVDASTLTPMIALPPNPDNVVPVTDVAGTTIAHATIGTSANGGLDDLRAVAAILRGRRIAQGVRLFIAPASRHTYFEALNEGLIKTFIAAGALIGTPGCSGCTGGSAFGVPADGQNMITSAPRNFVGRTGNRNANIYLASPATVIASALTGYITDPREFPPLENTTEQEVA